MDEGLVLRIDINDSISKYSTFQGIFFNMEQSCNPSAGFDQISFGETKPISEISAFNLNPSSCKVS